MHCLMDFLNNEWQVLNTGRKEEPLPVLRVRGEVGGEGNGIRKGRGRHEGLASREERPQTRESL